MARRGRPPLKRADEEFDEGEEDSSSPPAKVRRPTFHAGHPLSLESSGRRSVQATMAAVMADTPEDSVNLREAFLEWIAADFKIDIPASLRRVLEAALTEGLTRYEVETLLCVRGWLGEGAAIPVETWRRMRLAIKADSARAAVLLEETSAGVLRRAAMYAAAFEAAVEDSIHGSEILRGEARAGIVSLGTMLIAHQAELEKLAGAGEAAQDAPSDDSPLPSAAGSPLASLREAWASMRVRKSREADESAPAGE